MRSLIEYHKQSSYHRQEVLDVADATCFFCCQTFPSKQIEEWTDDGQTAICPYCGVDSILPFNMGTEALTAMHEYYFGIETEEGTDG